MLRRFRSSADGYVLALALVGLAVMAILAAGATRQASSAVRTADKAIRSEQAQYLAEAGVQRVTAAPPFDLPDGETERFQASDLDPELDEASYTVTVRREGDFLVIRSEGTAARGRNREQRTVENHLYAPAPDPGADPGGSEPGDGDDPGGTDDPGGSGPLIFRHAIWSDGPVDIRNNVRICGDIVTTGMVTVKNNATVWGKTKSQDRKSPCGSVAGTGMVVSARGVDVRNNATIQGGYCAPGRPGPCGSTPVADEVRPPRINLDALKEKAAEWWVQSSFACADRPEGATCKVLSSESHSLSGTLRYTEPTLIYVDANLTMQNNAKVDIYGPVTFIVNGTVTVGNNARLTCGGAGYCPIGLAVADDVMFAQNTEVHAFIHTDGEYRGLSKAVLYGNVIAKVTNFSKNNYTQHGFSTAVGPYPPGLLLETGEYTAGS